MIIIKTVSDLEALLETYPKTLHVQEKGNTIIDKYFYKGDGDMSTWFENNADKDVLSFTMSEDDLTIVVGKEETWEDYDQ